MTERSKVRKCIDAVSAPVLSIFQSITETAKDGWQYVPLNLIFIYLYSLAVVTAVEIVAGIF